MTVWKSVQELQNKNGILYFDGCNVLDLANDYSTPLYVYSKNRIRKNYQRLFKAYKKYYPKFEIYYAVKCNNNPAIVNILATEGAGADSSCPEEIEIAKLSHINEKKILYSGVYNSDKDLQYAVDMSAGLNLEDISQLERLAQLKIPEFLCFRINPGMGHSGTEGLIFAGPDAKFGISEKDVKKAYKIAKSYGVKKFGIHMMTGSNILAPDYFEAVVGKLLDIAGPVSQELGITFEFIDIGGSLGIPYLPEEKELDIDAVASSVVKILKEKLKQYSMGEPTLIHEPGRYLLGDAGMLLTTVSSIKEAEKTFIGVDAGMNTLLRPALYDAYHHILYANDLNASSDKLFNVVGPICENTDQFAKERLLPNEIKAGDVLAFLNTGAYGFCMSSQYNSKPQCAEILVNNGHAVLIRKPQTFQDLIKGTYIPGT